MVVNSSTEPVELREKFDLEQPLLYRALLFFIEQRKLTRKLQVIFLAIGLFPAIIVATKFGDRPALFLPAAIWFFVYAWFAQKCPSNAARASLKILKPDTTPGVLGEHLIEVTATTLTEATSVSRHSFLLGNLEAVHQLGEMTVIFTTPAGVIVVPKQADFGRDTFESFSEKLITMHARTRSGQSS